MTTGRRPAHRFRLSILRGRFAVVRLPARAKLPKWASSGSFRSVTRTGNELSIVCRERSVPAGVRREDGFRCIEVEGPLEFDAVGVLAALTAPLARARVPILAVSTFDTDYLLLRESQLAAATRALRRAGHVVSGGVE